MAKSIKEIFINPNCILKIILLAAAGAQIGFEVYMSTSINQLSFFGLLNSGVITIIIALLIAFIFFESTPRTEICFLAGCIILIGETLYKYEKQIPGRSTGANQHTLVMSLCIVEVILILLDAIFLQIKKKA